MKLRDDVEIFDQQDACTVVDAATGLKLVVPREIAGFLARLRDEAFAASKDAESENLLGFFRQLGLLNEAGEHTRAQQARYILSDCEFAELPRVRATVRRAFEHTALHREHLAKHLQPGTEWDLEGLPLLGKAQLRRHFPRGLTVDTLDLGAALSCGDLLMTSTSGTTGERLQVYSDTRVPRLPENFASLWGLQLSHGRPLRTAVLTSPGCAAGVCTRKNAPMSERISFEHTLFLESARDPFELTRDQVATMCTELAQFEPELWLVNPVYLLLFTECALQHQLALPKVRAIVSTYQLCSPSMRARFERAYGAPVFQLYSATELGGSQIGVSCQHGALHVNLDHVFVEVVKNGARVEPGQLGNPAVTTHHPSMPLVRYQLTDLVRFALSPCACEVGSAWPTLIVEGRERDAFVTANGLVSPAQIDAALQELPILLYRLEEQRPSVFQISVIAEQAVDAAAVRACLGNTLAADSLDVQFVTRLPFEESGKFRFTVPCHEALRG